MVNTFSMSVLERVREIGVLRATGMTSRQVWGMVVIEGRHAGPGRGRSSGPPSGWLVGALLVGLGRARDFGFVFDPAVAPRSFWPPLLRLPGFKPFSLRSTRPVWPAESRSSGPSNTSSDGNASPFASRPRSSRPVHLRPFATLDAPGQEKGNRLWTAPQPRRKRDQRTHLLAEPFRMKSPSGPPEPRILRPATSSVSNQDRRSQHQRGRLPGHIALICAGAAFIAVTAGNVTLWLPDDPDPDHGTRTLSVLVVRVAPSALRRGRAPPVALLPGLGPLFSPVYAGQAHGGPAPS